MKEIVFVTGNKGKRNSAQKHFEGTNIELYRAIVRKAGTVSNFGMNELRRVMKLNTVKSLVVEPSLCDGGVEGYVEGLYQDLNIK